MAKSLDRLMQQIRAAERTWTERLGVADAVLSESPPEYAIIRAVSGEGGPRFTVDAVATAGFAYDPNPHRLPDSNTSVTAPTVDPPSCRFCHGKGRVQVSGCYGFPVEHEPCGACGGSFVGGQNPAPPQD
jgi:hypothetical protein